MNPDLRIGDAERESAVVALGEHYAAGRLTKDEFDERTAAALTAPTQSALAPLFVDLPAPQAAGAAGSTNHATVRSQPSWSPSRTRHRRGWHPIPLLPVVVLLVALRVADLIPWFVFAIVVWFWCFGRFHRARRHVWHQSQRH